jgi:hypothetical protein
MFFNVIVDSVSDILKDVFIVSDGKIVEGGNNWYKRYYLN